MKNNKLVEYKDNIFTKIANFFKNIFSRKNIVETIVREPINNEETKDDFLENIVIKETEEEKRLKSLQLQYDNGEIEEEDILEEDIEKLIKMYEKETKELNADTERIKNHIAKMLKELKETA